MWSESETARHIRKVEDGRRAWRRSPSPTEVQFPEAPQVWNYLSMWETNHRAKSFPTFFDAAVFRLLCENTNKNAARNMEQGRKFSWAKISPDEMRRLIGSVLDLEKMTDFWCQNTIFMFLSAAQRALLAVWDSWRGPVFADRQEVSLTAPPRPEEPGIRELPWVTRNAST